MIKFKGFHCKFCFYKISLHFFYSQLTQERAFTMINDRTPIVNTFIRTYVCTCICVYAMFAKT